MNRIHVITLVALVSLLGAGAALAETDTATQTVTLTVNEVAEIAVTGNVAMTLDNPATPGNDPADQSDSLTRIQYTSVVTGAQTRKITAEITDGAIPGGTHLELGASGETANEGSPLADFDLTVGAAHDLVSSIGSVATGSGASDGLVLDYVWEVDSVIDLDTADSDVLTVTFTLTDDAA